MGVGVGDPVWVSAGARCPQRTISGKVREVGSSAQLSHLGSCWQRDPFPVQRNCVTPSSWFSTRFSPGSPPTQAKRRRGAERRTLARAVLALLVLGVLLSAILWPIVSADVGALTVCIAFVPGHSRVMTA